MFLFVFFMKLHSSLTCNSPPTPKLETTKHPSTGDWTNNLWDNQMAETVQPQERRNHPKGKAPNHHPERNKRDQIRMHIPDSPVLLFVTPHVALSFPLLSTKLKVGASSRRSGRVCTKAPEAAAMASVTPGVSCPAEATVQTV